MIGFVIAAVAAFLALAYFQAPLLAWTIAGGLLAAYLSAVAAFGATANVVLGTLFIVVAAVLNLRPLRRMLLSNPVLAIYRRILPDMSQTEKEAIDAGTVWWDADLFSGKPDWDKLLAIPEPRLTPEEQAFVDGPCEEVCSMTDDWEVTHERYDLPPQVWQYIKEKGFLGMIIPKSYGGLGFSALAHSAVVMKLSTRSNALAVTVMVPNSLGPAELLLHYGTEEQKNHYLPRLAKGSRFRVSPSPRRRRARMPPRFRITQSCAKGCGRERKSSACGPRGTSATSRSVRSPRCSGSRSGCMTRSTCSAARTTSASPARSCRRTHRAWRSAAGTCH